jgi:adenosine/AMP kinase
MVELSGTEVEVVMELSTVSIEVPDGLNVILGQSHFIKTVEDIHEVMVGASDHLEFGLAFCEASGRDTASSCAYATPTRSTC